MRRLAFALALAVAACLSGVAAPARADDCPMPLAQVPVDQRAETIVQNLRDGCDINGEDVVISGEVKLGGVTTDSRVNFRGAIFEDRVEFVGVTFNQDVDFTLATFRKGFVMVLGTVLDAVPPKDVPAVFKGEAVFERASFTDGVSCDDVGEGAAIDFDTTRFEQLASFNDTLFTGCASFQGAEFSRKASFGASGEVRSRFFGDAWFRSTRFRQEAVFRADFSKDAIFIDTEFYGLTALSLSEFDGVVWPPRSVGANTDLTWNDVKDSLPSQPLGHPNPSVEEVSANRKDVLTTWETFFRSGGQARSADVIRQTITREDLRPMIYAAVSTFGALFIAFFAYYWISFGGVARTSTARHILKLALFTADGLLPGVGALQYDWKTNGGLPVDRVSLATGIQSLLGWIILAIGAGIAGAWLTA